MVIGGDLKFTSGDLEIWGLAMQARLSLRLLYKKTRISGIVGH